MRRHLLIAAGLLALLSPAKAADSTVTALTAASALGGTELFYVVQGGADRKGTAAQNAAYVYGLMSGDAAATGLGALTLATVNANVGTFGSATSCITTTQNAKGLTTAISAATCTPAIGSITGLGTGVATALAVNIGSAGAPVLFNGALGTPSSGTLTNVTGLPIAGITGLGTGVAAQLAAAVSAAGGSTQTIAAGTAVLGTSAITSGACATAVTATATNTATTDTISFTPNADITAVTGYAPVTTGGLAIYPYPTANNVNFKVCNPTSSSITPGAVTLNWRVTR